MDEVKRFVGIDVAKAALDVFIGSAGMAFSVANDEVGIQQLLKQLTAADFVILEATSVTMVTGNTSISNFLHRKQAIHISTNRSLPLRP